MMENIKIINRREKEPSKRRILIDLLPDFIELETSTYCNRNCSWCPNSIYKQRSAYKNLISDGLFKKIINDLKNINYSKQIALHNYNEPLFDPKLFKWIKIIKQKLPKVKVLIFTNGDILDENYCEKLKKNGVSKIIITLHDAIFSKKREDVFLKHIKKLNFNEKKIKNISDWLGEKFRFHFGRMEVIYYIPYPRVLTSRGGILSGMEEHDKSPICFLPFSSSAIDYKGNMKICCEIYPEYRLHREKGIVGNLNKRSFIELWFSDFYNNFRKQILTKNFNNGICSHCPKNGSLINLKKLIKWEKFLGL